MKIICYNPINLKRDNTKLLKWRCEKMQKDRVKFFVDRENKVVVATIIGCRYDAIDKINSLISNVSSYEYLDVYFKSKLLMNDTYKAVAKCDDEDEFDEEIGKKIAMDKLTERYHKSLNNRIVKFIEMFDKVLDESVDYLVKRKFLVR